MSFIPPKTFLVKPIEDAPSGGCYADVYLPSTLSLHGAKLPVAMIIHGGGFTMGARAETPSAQVEFLLNKGVAVVDIDYRKTPHVGFEEQIADCRSAYDLIRHDLNGLLKRDGSTEAQVDEDKIALIGYSAGAYLASMLALQTSPVAVLLFYGLFDLRYISRTPKEAALLGFTPDERKLIDQIWDEGVTIGAPFMTTPRDSPRVLWMSAVMTAGAVVPFLLPSSLPDNDETRLKFSAAHLATATYPPTYFVVPQMDTLVPPTQSWMFEKRLKELGVEVHSVRVDEGVHGFDRKGGKLNEPEGAWWRLGTLPGLEFLTEKLAK